MLTDKITDDRIKLAEMILSAPEARLALIEALYPEYFNTHINNNKTG